MKRDIRIAAHLKMLGISTLFFSVGSLCAGVFSVSELPPLILSSLIFFAAGESMKGREAAPCRQKAQRSRRRPR